MNRPERVQQTEPKLKVVWAGKQPPGQELESEVAYTEGLWRDLTGASWMYMEGNFACLNYAARVVPAGLPVDDNVHYVHIGAYGYLVHETELVEVES